MTQIPIYKQREYATLYKIVSPDFTIETGFETHADAIAELLRGCGGTIPAGWYVAEYHPRDDHAEAQRILGDIAGKAD